MTWCLTILTMWGCGSIPSGGSAISPKRDNLTVLRSLVGEIAAELNSRYESISPDTVILNVDSSASAWIVRSEIASRLSAGGRRILTDGNTGPDRTRWAVHGIRLDVSYSDIRKPGLFSEPLVDREIRAGFTTEISNQSEILGSNTAFRTFRDTVKENEVAYLENREIEFTRGTVPDLNSWDRFIEPFVIIGAAGTAIFLFFQVRS